MPKYPRLILTVPHKDCPFKEIPAILIHLPFWTHPNLYSLQCLEHHWTFLSTLTPNVQPPDRSLSFRPSTKIVTTEAGLMIIILSAASPCLMMVSPVKKTWELHLVRKVFRKDFEKPLKKGCSSNGSGASSLNLFSAISRNFWHASGYWSSNVKIPPMLISTILQTVNALMVASRSVMPAKLKAPDIPPTK